MGRIMKKKYGERQIGREVEKRRTHADRSRIKEGEKRRTETKTDRHTDRQTDKETGTLTDKQAVRDRKNTDTDRPTGRRIKLEI